MGKVYKRKLRSCPLCKPHKTGHAKKNKDKVRFFIDESDKEIAFLIGRSSCDAKSWSTLYQLLSDNVLGRLGGIEL